MEDKADMLSERLLNYGEEIVKLVVSLERTTAGRHIAGQLLRSGTSAGANYEEARGAHGRADFVHKLRIVIKEVRESLYWLRLAERAGLSNGVSLVHLLDETEQLARIVGRSLLTASKGKQAPTKPH